MSGAAIKGACHCGAVTFEVSGVPPTIVSCNCSICRRYAALWLHSHITPSVIDAPEVSTRRYNWGDKGIDFHSCTICGCITHWSSRVDDRYAVNLRMADPAAIEGIRVRHFDGADSWKFTD